MAASAGLLVGCEPLRSEDTGEGSLTLSWLFVQLTPAKGGGAARRVDLDDCVGVSAEQNVLVLQSVALRRGCCSAPRRVMGQTRFTCRDGAQAESLAAAVWNVMHGKAPEASAPARKRWLILVNPVSGKKGGALKVLRECRPVLEAHRVELKEIVTTHAGHATELAAEIKLDELDGVVCVGGDGLLYELVNGLMARSDADVAVSRLHLGVLPGGSANSMCCSLLRAAGEPLSPLAMARLLCKGRQQPLDLLRVTQPGGHVSYGFLSLAWALASDIDLGSEHLRWMGEARFDVYAVWRILTQRRYPGTLRVKEKGAEQWRTIEGPFIGLWALNVRWLTPSAQIGPRAEFDDGCIDLLHFRRVNRLRLLLEMADLSSGRHVNAQWAEYTKVTALELCPQPRTEKQPGMVAIDGELVPFAETSIVVLPSKLMLLGGAAQGDNGGNPV